MYTSKRNTLWSALLLLIQFLSKGRVSVRVFQPPPHFQWPRYAPDHVHWYYLRFKCVLNVMNPKTKQKHRADFVVVNEAANLIHTGCTIATDNGAVPTGLVKVQY